MSESKPVVENPDSVTQWTCPKAPTEGMTHHIVNGGACEYCGDGVIVLKIKQRRILSEQDGVSASNARQSKFYETHDRTEAAGPDIVPTPEELEDARLSQEDVPLVVNGELTDAGEAYVAQQRSMPDEGNIGVSETIVELTPEQAFLMLKAKDSEEARLRHEKEPWEGQAARDRHNRIHYIQLAVAAGVPLKQVQRFIWGDKVVPR